MTKDTRPVKVDIDMSPNAIIKRHIKSLEILSSPPISRERIKKHLERLTKK
jgi:hypothetical protein